MEAAPSGTEEPSKRRLIFVNGEPFPLGGDEDEDDVVPLEAASSKCILYACALKRSLSAVSVATILARRALWSVRAPTRWASSMFLSKNACEVCFQTVTRSRPCASTVRISTHASDSARIWRSNQSTRRELMSRMLLPLEEEEEEDRLSKLTPLLLLLLLLLLPPALFRVPYRPSSSAAPPPVAPIP